MGAEFGAFFDDDDRNFRAKLFEADRGGETGGASAGDHDIEIHSFAWRQSDFCLGHGGFRSLRGRNSIEELSHAASSLTSPKVLGLGTIWQQRHAHQPAKRSQGIGTKPDKGPIIVYDGALDFNAS